MTTKAGKRPVNPLVTGIYLCCLGLLLGLGAWQFMRGMEKARLEKKVQDQAGMLHSLNGRPPDWGEYNYGMVQLEGHLLSDRSFLLDNRIHNGKLGYEILSPFQLSRDGTVILVNRGWIAREMVTGNLFPVPDAEAAIVTGQLYFPTNGFTLGPAYIDADKWPVVVQYIDLPAMSVLLEAQLEAPVVVLDVGYSNELVRIWQPYVMDASRHYGYAVQWWGLSIVFIVFGLIWRRMSLKR